MQRIVGAGLVTLVVAATGVVGMPQAFATPVAADDASYERCGRVFPDPQAFAPAPSAAPGESPYAKGNAACRAVDFIQFGEAVDGMRYLEKKFPRFVKVFDLSKDFADVLDETSGEGLSAGLAQTDLSRLKSPLYMIRITDETVPERDKKHFLFTLSLHGIEKAGVEGGLRAAEDLATWGATAPDRPIMETDDTSVRVGDALRRSTVYFVLANPDGWRRGDTSTGGPFYQRYNGNGVDINRDWPEKGYTFRPYTPWSEPETRALGKVWKSIRPTWHGGVDLHGQLIDRAFSFTLLGASQRPYDKNQRMMQFTQGAYADAEQRLAWNPLIKPNDAPEACVPPGTSGTVNEPPDCDPTPRVYGVQYGSIWDTIAYTVTGAIGDWADSDLGLNADFIDNEMSLSHLVNCGTGKCYSQSAEQLHVDGNKSLVYAMINYTLLPEDTTFSYTGKVAYLYHPDRLRNSGSSAPRPSNLPVQPALATQLQHTGLQDTTYEFDVKGASAGFGSGGVSAKVTFSNLQGVSPDSLLGVTIDRFNSEEAEPGGSQWTTVNSDFNQAPTYLQAGMQVDANDLVPGRYRLRITGEVPALASAEITFTKGRAWPDPGQQPYDVSNMDFFDELRRFVPDGGRRLVKVPADRVARGADLSSYDTVVAVDRTLRDPKVAAALKRFAEAGGNVVLTDDAVRGLETMGLVPKGSVGVEKVYAGSVSFQATADDGAEATYDDPLARGVDLAGSAEGPRHRRQVTEPVPVGYAIQNEDGGDASTMPQYGVAADAWAKGKGRVVGVTGDSSKGLVTYGELPVGKGVVRILGSFLPMPTAQFDHPFGLSDYAITFTAYELAKNLFSYGGATRGSSSSGSGLAPAAGGGGRGGLAHTGYEPSVLALFALAAAVLVARRRRAARA